MSELDPFVWGEYANFGVVPVSRNESELALELLGMAQEVLWDLCQGVAISPDRAANLQTEIALAANHFGWWMEAGK